MFLKIKNLLSAPELSRLVALSRELRFVDGRVSNPANQTKDNLQADANDPKYAESVQIVGNAFLRSREFMDFALPKRVAPPLLCRYEPGMKYGAHADAALIPLGSARIRSDLSCTVFINDSRSTKTSIASTRGSSTSPSCSISRPSPSWRSTSRQRSPRRHSAARSTARSPSVD